MSLNIKINPLSIQEANLDPSQLEALSHFLEGNNKNLWDMNINYQYKYNNIDYSFCFTKTLLRRKRRNGKIGERFEIFDENTKPLGKGGYAIVYPILGTIKLDLDKPVIKKNKKNRIVKIERNDGRKRDREKEIIREYQLLTEVGNLKVYPPVFIQNINQKSSVLVMERADGYPLESILNPEKRQRIAHLIPELTVQKRWELSVALLKAIKEQITDKGLIHRDLKPGNIMVDLNVLPPALPKVTIIDYGNAIKGNLQEKLKVGTSAYRAPELYLGIPHYTSKVDSYATGRILSYIWGDHYENYYIERNSSWDNIKKLATNKNLFCDPQIGLFKKDRDIIKNCLQDLLDEDKNRRSSIDEALAEFSRVDMRKYQLKMIQRRTHSELDELEQTWDQQIKKINVLLERLSNKGVELKQKGFIKAGKKAEQLALQLKQNTKILISYQEPLFELNEYRDKSIKELNRARKELKNNRNSNWLIAEIFTAISLLGVGYLFAVAINYQLTGRLQLFKQTNTDHLAEEIQNTIYQIST